MNKMLTAAALLLASLGWAAKDEARLPAVAGQFYPAKPAEIAALIERYLVAAPSSLSQDADIVALLVPHAGLEFSGLTAARAYKTLRRGAFDAVIVVGTCHYKELEGAALYPDAYGTPEGNLPYDAALGQALMDATPLIKADAAAHKKDHSVEVQIPFLRKTLGPVPLVALVMNTADLETSRRIGLAIAKAVKGKRVLLIASSDLSHYPGGGIADAVDRATLAALETLDPAYFWLTNRFLMNRGLPHLAVTYCGEGAVLAVLTAARELGATKVRTLLHINSGDVVSERDYNHVVGYAAVAFTREPGAAPARLALSAKQKASLVAVARKAVIETAAGRKLHAPLSAEPAFNLPAAVFVTLSAKDGSLRGCIGSTAPQESLLEAVVRNAGLAASADHRFKPVAADEAPALQVEVSVLSPSRPAKADEIKPGDGAIVEKDGRVGVFLPDVWKSLPDKERFLGELCAQKAGLNRDCWKDAAVQLKIFSVDAFGD